MSVEPGSRAARWGTSVLGAVVACEGLGKLIAPAGYVDALAKFDALPRQLLWPIAVAWIALELASGIGLLVAGLAAQPPRRSVLAAAGALTASCGYLALTLGAYLRGLHLDNCTCFGVYLAQRLSLFVLFQDVYMIAYSGWQVSKLRRWLWPTHYRQVPVEAQ